MSDREIVEVDGQPLTPVGLDVVLRFRVNVMVPLEKLADSHKLLAEAYGTFQDCEFNYDLNEMVDKEWFTDYHIHRQSVAVYDQPFIQGQTDPALVGVYGSGNGDDDWMVESQTGQIKCDCEDESEVSNE